MNKPLLVFQAPVATRSGYGDHSRDILKSLFELDKYDVKVVPTRWGNTPQDQIDPTTGFGQKILQNIVARLDRQPDIFIQVSVANEFRKVGKYFNLITDFGYVKDYNSTNQNKKKNISYLFSKLNLVFDNANEIILDENAIEHILNGRSVKMSKVKIAGKKEFTLAKFKNKLVAVGYLKDGNFYPKNLLNNFFV